VVIIAAQVTFLYSFRSISTSVSTDVSGTSAVVVSKLKCAYMSASIHIWLPDFDSSVLLIFPNGTQREIIQPVYSIEVLLPRSGGFSGDYDTGTIVGTSDAYPDLKFSRNRPIRVDVVPNVSDNFLNWYDDTDHSKYVDVYWFKIQGNAHVVVSGDGVTI
jgi:hypothetical protein